MTVRSTEKPTRKRGRKARSRAAHPRAPRESSETRQREQFWHLTNGEQLAYQPYYVKIFTKFLRAKKSHDNIRAFKVRKAGLLQKELVKNCLSARVLGFFGVTRLALKPRG
jgi:hypothetical protein